MLEITLASALPPCIAIPAENKAFVLSITESTAILISPVVFIVELFIYELLVFDNSFLIA